MDDELARELCPPAYPAGAYALYGIMREHRLFGVTSVEIVRMVDKWADSGDALSGLNTVTQVLDCADALTKGGYLQRRLEGQFERWTVHEEKPQMPGEQKRGDTP
jgi:hypothetical protein